MAPLWREAFDLFERPLAGSAESWVQSDTFMDLTAAAVKMQRRFIAEVQSAMEQWLALWGLVSRADAVKLMAQVGSLEREVRDLKRQLDRREAGAQPHRAGDREAA